MDEGGIASGKLINQILPCSFPTPMMMKSHKAKPSKDDEKKKLIFIS
jgi:hypothetical protein